LAREAAAYEVDWLDAVGSQSLGGKGSHVVVNWDGWPMSSEYCSGVSLALAKRDGSHTGAFEPEAKAADTREEVEHAHKLLRPRAFAHIGNDCDCVVELAVNARRTPAPTFVKRDLRQLEVAVFGLDLDELVEANATDEQVGATETDFR
jgi:hypothetical protein